MSLFVLVVGSILTGFATPTESAALGAIGAVDGKSRSMNLAAVGWGSWLARPGRSLASISQ